MDRPLRYDYYKVLGVPRGATAREIKCAYRERAMQWHPDRNGSERAPEAFRTLHEAYRILSDAAARADYDGRLMHYRQAPVHAEGMPPRSPRTRMRPAAVASPTRGERALFHGLHATGLAFAVLLLGSIGIGCAFFGWPLHLLFLTLPGLVVLPDSIEGLRAR